MANKKFVLLNQLGIATSKIKEWSEGEFPKVRSYAGTVEAAAASITTDATAEGSVVYVKVSDGADRFAIKKADGTLADNPAALKGYNVYAADGSFSSIFNDALFSENKIMERDQSKIFVTDVAPSEIEDSCEITVASPIFKKGDRFKFAQTDGSYEKATVDDIKSVSGNQVLVAHPDAGNIGTLDTSKEIIMIANKTVCSPMYAFDGELCDVIAENKAAGEFEAFKIQYNKDIRDIRYQHSAASTSDVNKAVDDALRGYSIGS